MLRAIKTNAYISILTFFCSTSVSCAWEYSSISDIDFDHTWQTVKEIILQNFAGDPVEGVPSPSVQNTIYLSQKDVLEAVKQVTGCWPQWVILRAFTRTNKWY